MSALDRPKIEDAERVISAAENMLGELCHGKRFEMCIPVQETDTDVVIGNALYIARQLLAERDALREAARWVPVGERLPIAGVRVDILRKCPDGYDYQNGTFTERNGRLKWWSEILACELRYVIAWRELPAPAEGV